MNVSLTPELERYIHGKLESGHYQTASDVVLEGLRLLKEKEELQEQKLAELRREVQLGIDQADRGEMMPLTDEVVQEIKSRGRLRLASQQGSSGE